MSGLPENLNQQLESWELIWSEVVMMQHRREIYKEFVPAVLQDPEVDTHFFGLFQRMYVESQFLTIRRLSDKDNRTASFRCLLGQLQSNHREMTRSRFMELYFQGTPDRECPLRQQDAHSGFDRYTNEKSSEYLAKGIVVDHLAELKGKVSEIEKYINDHIAHKNQNNPEYRIEWQEIDSAIDFMAEMLKFYGLLIDGSDWGTAVTASDGSQIDLTIPSIGGDWRQPFRRPLWPPYPD